MKKFSDLLVFILVLYVMNRLIVYREYAMIKQPNVSKPLKAIVVGATSGIGRQVAKLLAKDGYEVGLVGRRLKLLQSLHKEIKTKTYIKQIDVSQMQTAKKQLEELIEQMGRLDLIFISVSAQGDLRFGVPTSQMSWDEVKKFIDVDLNGFWVAAHVAMKQFEKQGYGHLVGVSSIQKIKGFSGGPEYSGAKAFIGKYLDGVRNRMLKSKLPIFVTEIIPGPVDVERQKYSDVKGLFWVATKEDAAQQILQAIKNKKEKAYITKRWKLIGWILSIIPDWLYRKLEK